MLEKKKNDKEQIGNPQPKSVFFGNQRERMSGRPHIKIHEVAGGKVIATEVDEENSENSVEPKITISDSPLMIEKFPIPVEDEPIIIIEKVDEEKIATTKGEKTKKGKSKTKA